MFKKIAAITDLHLGAKSNSIVHNKDCEDFIDWFISKAKEENCDTGIFLGDWSHNRNNINLLTLDVSIRCLEKLGAAFDQFFWFPGNHDLFYKDRRDTHSSLFGKHIPGITVVNEITTIDDVTMMPWLIGDEWKKIHKIKSRYLFGHLELPHFYMNAMVQMPDHGEIQVQHFERQEYVFSGHFHKRQHNQNIAYIGNCFPHNFADAGDTARGMMIFNHSGVPEYHAWPDQPTYYVYKLSELLGNPETLLKEKMHVRVPIDIPISFEESTFIKETFVGQYGLRELVLIPEKVNLEGSDIDVIPTKFESVDSIVVEQLTNISSENFDQKILLEIYNHL